MQVEFQEYNTFFTTNKTGETIELAVMDTFEYEHKNYVVGALIEDEAIREGGMFIFYLKEIGEEIKVEKITDSGKYNEIAKAYMEMEE